MASVPDANAGNWTGRSPALLPVPALGAAPADPPRTSSGLTATPQMGDTGSNQ